MNVQDWQAPDGFLSFYHKWHPDHGKPFADSVHHTTFWLMEQLMNGKKSINDVRSILVKGMRSRWNGKGYLKYPGSNQYISDDNAKFLVPLLYHVGEKGMADFVRKEHLGAVGYLPQWRDVIEEDNTFLGRVFEAADAVTDWFSDSQSSQIKNVGRLCWLAYRGHKKSHATKLFNERVDAYRAMEIYFGRYVGQPSSEYPTLPPKPSVVTPPPVYLDWDRIIKRYMK